MKNLRNFILSILALAFSQGYTQELTQTVRGVITDFDTKTPIIGANIIIIDSEPFKGTTSDVNGKFRLENVPVGRIQLKIRSVGYQEIIIPNLLIESGKEKVMTVEMLSDIKMLSKVEVSAQKDKSESINKMASVSGKTFTVEETNRYAGTLNDPSRMVSAFPGVNSDAEGDNDIVVRGNSPRGVLWRLEGIDIPNPNHFADNGSTGGPVNALNGAVLANSDFFSGAFAPEYGNALSGVFDVNFRQGNNETREYAFSVGALGIDATAEGPFKPGYGGSYLVNYRYSTVGILDKLGILDFSGIPIYQDAAFKFVLPTKKAGTFSLIGLGGVSNIDQTAEDDETGEVFWKYNFGANLGVAALKHTYIISPKTYVKSYVSGSTSSNGGEGFFPGKDSVLFLSERDKFTNNRIAIQSILNHKANQKNLFQIGATISRLNYDFFYEDDYDEDGIMKQFIKSKGNAELLQSFVSWKYRLNNDLTFVSGLHHTHFFLNDNYAVEPRLGIKWRASNRHDFSAGFGMHSRLESLSTYMYNRLQDDGSYFYPNQNLDFTKSIHYVLGYGYRINENLRFKSEVYYQHLYNVPVSIDPNSNFSLINFASGIPGLEMDNQGTGRNYGLELTLERFFSNNFYYLATGSIYKSDYTGQDGIQRDSRYDARFASNLLLGKEFKFGKNKNKTFGLNTKVSYLGGNRYTPIDLEASIAAGETVRTWDAPYSAKGDDVFIFNVGLTYRVDKANASHSFKIDARNATNHQAVVNQYYNSSTESIEEGYQLSFIPNIIYTIKF